VKIAVKLHDEISNNKQTDERRVKHNLLGGG